MKISRAISSMLITLLLPLALCAQQLSDREAQLRSSLAEYFAALERESVEVKIAEADFIIGATKEDGGDRKFVTREVFDHYQGSKLMGDEAVALHVFDRWMSDPGYASSSTDAHYLAASLWAGLNRASMIGCKAPSLTLETLNGSLLTIPSSSETAVTVLYFYSTDCAKCRLESFRMRFLDFTDVTLYAVCCSHAGDDPRSEWRTYAETYLDEVSCVHLFDPDGSSNLEYLYNVTATPRIFLLDGSGTIIGRMLDVDALARLIELANPYSDEASSLQTIEAVFDAFEDGLTRNNAEIVRDHIRSVSLGSDSPQWQDTVLYKSLTSALLSYLGSVRGPDAAEALEALIVEDILPLDTAGGFWKGDRDYAYVLAPARLYSSLLCRIHEGDSLPKLWVRSDKGLLRLWRQANQKIVFYDPDCSTCKETLAGLKNSAEVKSYILIDISAQRPSVRKALLENFDLTRLPFILTTDSASRVKERYL